MLRRNHAIASAVVLGVILYGSLYPFEARTELPPWGAWTELFDHWRSLPLDGGDALANLLFYLPFGFFAAQALNPRLGTKRPLPVILAGLALSVSLELAQFYIAGRYTDIRDVYNNTLGTALGALAGITIGGNLRWAALREMKTRPFPLMLLVAWLGVRLYPLVPVIDLHKYWHAIRNLGEPGLTHGARLLDAFQQPDYLTGAKLYIATTLLWLVIAYIVETLTGRRASALAYLLLVGLVVLGKVMMVDTALTRPDLAGAVLAFGLWFLALRFVPGRVALLALAMAFLVTLERLAPNRFSALPHSFDWVPFFGLLHSSIQTALLVFLEKFFVYGSLIWLFCEAGLRLWRSTLAIALLLLFTSAVERYLPGRSAEITDAVMALLIGLLLKLMSRPAAPPAPPPRRVKSAQPLRAPRYRS